jgi:hypothetical protein
VPSGVWDASEYAKLPEYDKETWEQPQAAFHCHQGDGSVCAGWLGYGNPTDLLAVRIGISAGAMDPSCADYTTDVPLFDSGQEAADHGVRDINGPSAEAWDVIRKVSRIKGVG